MQQAFQVMNFPCIHKVQEKHHAKLISAFVYATQIVQPLYFLNPKFQASRHLLWLYSPGCAGPGRQPECWFSHDTAHF